MKPNEYLTRIALAVLKEGVTPDEAEQMVQVLISRKNKVDDASDVVREAQRQVAGRWERIRGGGAIFVDPNVVVKLGDDGKLHRVPREKESGNPD